MTDELRQELDAVLKDPASVWAFSREHATALLACLAGAAAALEARAGAAGPIRPEDAQPAVDRGLSAEEAAALLGGEISAAWLRRYGRKLPFARQISRQQIIFSERGIQRFLAAGLSAVRPFSPRAPADSGRRA